mgnify:CR=1 FL=1
MSDPESFSSDKKKMASSASSGKALIGGVVLLVVLAMVLAGVVFRPGNRDNSPQVIAPDGTEVVPAITVNTEPRQSVSGRDVQPAPSVVVTDAQGSPVAGLTVSVALQPGTFAAGSVAQTTTDAEGKAVFENLKVDKAGAYRLAFSASGYPPAQSAEFVVRFGIPRVLTIVSEPQSGLAGAPVPGDPAVRVTDESGNPVPGINVDLLLEAADSAGRKLATVPSDASGMAVFRDIVITAPGTDYRLKFDARAAGVNDAVSSPFNLTNS